jgi:hypothetical protein
MKFVKRQLYFALVVFLYTIWEGGNVNQPCIGFDFRNFFSLSADCHAGCVLFQSQDITLSFPVYSSHAHHPFSPLTPLGPLQLLLTPSDPFRERRNFCRYSFKFCGIPRYLALLNTAKSYHSTTL